MPTPDVRVRLSAEGVAEVVGALKKIQDESAKTVAKQSRGFGSLNNILGGTSNLLAGLGVALSVGAFTNFIRNSAQAADQQGKLAQKVGASVENLSALSLAARAAEIDDQQLARGLVNLNKRVAELAEGSPQATGLFKDLSLSLKDFKDKDAAERFELVARGLATMGAGYEKTKTAQDLFGRSGADLIPLMDQLAEEGLGRLIERARDLGVLLDSDIVAAIDQMNADMGVLKLQSQGLGVQFATGVGPRISQALQIMSGDLKQTKDSWKSFGEGVGVVLKFIVAVVSSAFDIIGTVMGTQLIAWDGLLRGLVNLHKGRFEEAKENFRVAARAIGQEATNLKARLTGRFDLLVNAPPPPEKKTTPTTTKDEEDPAEAVRRRAEAARAVLDNELAMVRLQAKLRNDAERRSFDEGLTNVREYYRRRREIAAQEVDQEVALLLKKRALLSAETDPGKQASEAAKIDAEVAGIRLEQQNELATTDLEETRVVRELAKERLGIEQKILEAQGERHQAALLGIEEEIDKTDLLLRKQGASDADRQAELTRLRGVLEGRANFEEAKRQAEAGLAELDAARSEIQARADAGLISQFEAEQQILAVERDRLIALQDLAAALLAAAQAAGDPEAIAQAQAFSDAIRDIGVSVQGATDFLARFKATAIDATTSALAEFFDTGISKAKNLKEAFRDMALSIIADLKRMAAQALATAIMKAVLSSFSSGGKVDVEKKAGGGLLGGRGTGTSDSNLAWVSRGEYIVRAAAVSQPGVLRHLEQLNRGGVRTIVTTPVLMPPPLARYAGGGLVDAPAAAGPIEGKLTVGLDDGLILRHLESSAGQRIMVQQISRNRRAVRAALGL